MSLFLNSREQKVFMICLVVVFSAVFYNGLIAPLQREANSIYQEIVLRKKQLNGSMRVIQKAESFDARYDSYLKRFGKTGTGEEVSSLILSEIEQIARKLELHISELTPKKIKHNELDDQFSVRLTISSEFVDIVRFLYTLQQAPYLFDVEEVEFRRSARRGRGAVTTRLVLGKTFILTGPRERKEGRGDGGISL